MKCEWLVLAYKRRRRCYLNVIASPFICVLCIDCLHLFRSVCLRSSASQSMMLCCNGYAYKSRLLEFCTLWSTWERNNVTDILHSCYEKNKTFEAQSESTMRTTSVFACIKLPPHILHWDSSCFDFVHQLVVVFFTNTTSNDLTNLWE